MNQESNKSVSEGFILVESLNPNKRVRLIDGRLTPFFEYASQAFNYCKGKGINNCRIIKIKKISPKA